jgi:AraC family transcriptional regulator
VLLARETRCGHLLETTYSAGERLRSHAHELPHLCLVLEGEYLETVQSRSLYRLPMSLSFLPAGCPHDEAHRTAGRHFLIEVAAPLLDGTELACCSSPTSLDDAAASRTAARLYYHFRSPTSLDQQQVADDIVELVSHTGEGTGSVHTPWVQRTRAMVHDGFRGRLTLSMLAEDARVHPVHLAQSFRRSFRCTVGEYVRQLRVRYACAELIRSDRPISVIALEAGFSDQSHLTRCFRRLIGTSPGRYRRVVRGPFS